MARRRDRYLRRRKKTVIVLAEYGLPADHAERQRLLAETADHFAGSDASKTHPYDLRTWALTEKLPSGSYRPRPFSAGTAAGFQVKQKNRQEEQRKRQNSRRD